MPTRHATCNICGRHFTGKKSYTEAKKCENQGPPAFAYSVGQVIAYMEILEQITRCNRKGDHVPYYRVMNATSRKEKVHNERDVEELDNSYTAHLEMIRRLEAEKAPSVTTGGDGEKTAYRTAHGWYVAADWGGSFYPNDTQRVAELDTLLQKNKSG